MVHAGVFRCGRCGCFVIGLGALGYLLGSLCIVFVRGTLTLHAGGSCSHVSIHYLVQVAADTFLCDWLSIKANIL